MLVVGVGEDRALGEELVQAALIFAAEAGQVIVAELVDRDGDDQFRLRGSQ